MSSESKRKGPKSKIALFSSAIASNQIVQLSLVVVLAIAIRVVYLLQYKANAPYYSIMIVDSRYYDEWAQRVAAGKGYGPMPFYMAPLYPYFLAILYKIFGHNFTPIYILQAALGIVNACLVYVLGRKLFGHLSGLIAMLLILFYAPLVYLEAKILTETLAIAINLCSILLLMRAIERPSAGRFLGAGILLGVSAVCRPNSLITIGLFIAWLWLFGRRMARFYTRQLFPLIIGVVLAIAPVTARNYFIGNDLVLITSNGGIVFAQANNEAANGVSSAMAGFSASIMTQQQEEMAIASRALGHQVKPSESAAFWFRQGLTFIRDHPGRFIRLLALKLLWSLHDVEARCSFNVYLEKTFVPILRCLLLPFSLLAGSALYGIIRGRKQWTFGASLIALYILSIFLSLIIFSVSSRYRVPAAPALAVFAGFGIVSAAKDVWRRRIKPLFALLGCIAIFLGISSVPYPIPKITAGGYNNLGAALVRQGRLDEAVIQYKRALKVKPNHFSAHVNLANVLAAQGKLDEAAVHYREAIRIKPDDVEPHFGLGIVLIGKGCFGEAIEELSEAIRLNPGNADAHLKLGEAFAAVGRRDEAIREYREAIRLSPRDARAHFELGVLYGEKGLIDDEVREYREAIRLRPNFGEAHNNLAVALYYKGRYDEAWEEVRLSRRYGVSPDASFLKALSEKMPRH